MYQPPFWRHLGVIPEHSCNGSCTTVIYTSSFESLVHTTIGCGNQGFPPAQPYLGHAIHTVNSKKVLNSNIFLEPRSGAGVSDMSAISKASSTRGATQYYISIDSGYFSLKLTYVVSPDHKILPRNSKEVDKVYCTYRVLLVPSQVAIQSSSRLTWIHDTVHSGLDNMKSK